MIPESAGVDTPVKDSSIGGVVHLVITLLNLLFDKVTEHYHTAV